MAYIHIVNVSYTKNLFEKLALSINGDSECVLLRVDKLQILKGFTAVCIVT